MDCATFSTLLHSNMYIRLTMDKVCWIPPYNYMGVWHPHVCGFCEDRVANASPLASFIHGRVVLLNDFHLEIQGRPGWHRYVYEKWPGFSSVSISFPHDTGRLLPNEFQICQVF